jgi:hypothetical protein
LVADLDTEVMGWVLGSSGPGWGRGRRRGWSWTGRGGRFGAGGGAGGGAQLVFLPPYSPELQPVERVWPLVNEAVQSVLRDLEEMMEVVAERCRVLAQDPETLRRHTLFHWWPRTRL